MSEKVRLGFVGSGRMGQLAHIANYAIIPDCELVALAEGRMKTAEAVAQRYGIQQIYRTHKEMLEKADLDGVVAIMKYNLHHAIVPDILEAGKPIATEKPICVRLDTAKKLLNLAKEKDVLYQVGYMKRHDPASKFVKKTIQQWRKSGECGDMTYVRIMICGGDWTGQIEPPIDLGDNAPKYENETPEPMPHWIPPSMQKIYNKLIDFFIHQINLLRYLIDEDYEVAYVDRKGRIMVVRTHSGVPCTFEMAPYGLKNRWEESYEIRFERGKINLSLPAPMARQRAGEVVIYKASDENSFPQIIKPLLPQKWEFLEQARHFIECLRDSKPTISPASESLKDLKVSEQYIRTLLALYEE